jgi:hypothetical protein
LDNGWDVMLSQYVEYIENQIHVHLEDTFGSLTLSQVTDLPEMKNELMNADFDIGDILDMMETDLNVMEDT